jgi:hypothetical protein
MNNRPKNLKKIEQILINFWPCGQSRSSCVISEWPPPASTLAAARALSHIPPFKSLRSFLYCVAMSWLKSLACKRAQPSAAAAALPPQCAQPVDADDFLSDSLLPVEHVNVPRPAALSAVRNTVVSHTHHI